MGSDALQVIVTWQSVALAWRVGNRLRLDLAKHALRLDLDWHADHSAGLLIERLDGDVAAIVDFSSVAVLQLVGNAILLVGVLVVSLVIDWRAGLLILASVAVGGYLMIRLRTVAVPAHDAEREIQSQLYGDLEERLGGLEDLRANGAGAYAVHRLEHHSARWWTRGPQGRLPRRRRLRRGRRHLQPRLRAHPRPRRGAPPAGHASASARCSPCSGSPR